MLDILGMFVKILHGANEPHPRAGLAPPGRQLACTLVEVL